MESVGNCSMRRSQTTEKDSAPSAELRHELHATGWGLFQHYKALYRIIEKVGEGIIEGRSALNSGILTFKVTFYRIVTSTAEISQVSRLYVCSDIPELNVYVHIHCICVCQC